MRANMKSNYAITLMYSVMLILVFAIVIYLAFHMRGRDPAYDLNHVESTSVSFIDDDGNAVKDTMNLYEHGVSGKIYTVLPDNLDEGLSLCFRAKHLFFDIYVDGELIYKQNLDQNRFYTKSPGAQWIMVPLKSSYSGSVLTITYRTAYNSKNCGFDNCGIERGDLFILSVIKDKMIPIFMCMIYVVVGILLILLNMVINKFVKEEKSLFWLGMMSLSIASYCMLETQVLQIFYGNSQLMHVMVMFAMALIPVPGVVYTSMLFRMKNLKLVHFVVSLSFFNFMIQTVLNYFGILDYHENIIFFQLLILLSIILMFVWIISYIVRYFGNTKKLNIYVKAMVCGIICIISTGVVDIIRYWLCANTDPARFIRYGFFGFVICFAFASSESVMNAFQNSMKMKVVSKLAYEDGLTGLKNRTSYQEMIERIELEQISTGVIMMDLNNLKYVNDTFGHDDGDEMLIETAKLIREAFCKPGMTHYRIGGDEFVVFVQTENVETDSRNGMRDLEKHYRNFNAETLGHYKIVIAMGYDEYVPFGKDSMDEVLQEADAIMYENKRQLKQQKFLNVML